MKNKIFILVAILLLVVLGVVGFILTNKPNEEDLSIITLDINPSIEIKVNKDNKVKSITALNDDAKEIVKDVENGDLEESLKKLIDNLYSSNYLEERYVVIIMHVEGTNNNYEDIIRRNFEEKEAYAEIITINEISKEDKELAKKYNITPAKAAYINAISKETNIDVEVLANKPAEELKDTKERGTYCDDGYILEGDWCLKETNRVPATNGQVCPEGYLEYQGKCYEEKPSEETGVLKCRNGYTLKNEKCIRMVTENAFPNEYECSKGELKKKSEIGLSVGGSGDDTYVCADTSTAKEPVLRCLNNSGHIMINGKCYNGPAPTINGGCPNGDTLRNGWCYSLDSYDQYECPDGKIYEKSKGSVPKYCPDTIKTTKPTIKSYKCNEGFTLDDTKCIKEETEDPEREKKCPDGFTTVNNDRCINYNNIKAKVDGYYCENEHARLRGSTCVIYEMIEAKHN